MRAQSRMWMSGERATRVSRVVLSLCLAPVAACSDGSTAPTDTYELPTPDLRRDPALMVFGDTLMRCGQWVGPETGSERLVVDVQFSGVTSQYLLGALDDHVQAVERTGGRVLVGFPFAAVRARLTKAQAIALATQWPGVWIFSVPNAARYDWSGMSVFYTDGFVEADSLFITELGGRTRSVSPNRLTAIVDLPATSITPLRVRVGASSVYPLQQLC